MENVIGLLKSKFRRLGHTQRNDERRKYTNIIIDASIIHNLLIEI